MKIIFNNGASAPIQSVAGDDGILTIRILNQTFDWLKTMFTDADAIKSMTVQDDTESYTIYDDYTELVRISEYTGAIWEVEMRQVKATVEARLERAEAEIKELQESGGSALPETARLVMQYATETMTDAQALKVKEYVEPWRPNGVTYIEGKRVSDEKGGELKLYRCLQTHVSEETHRPSIDTASIWVLIDEVHEGTKEDPIPWFANMRPEKDKYYIEGELLAKCIEDPGQALYNKLSELCPGRYFEAV